MKNQFKLPETKLSKVTYMFGHGKNEYLRSCIIPTPPNNDAFQTVMLSRKVGFGQIRSIQPVNSVQL